MSTTATNSGPSRFLDLRALAALEQRRFVTRHQIEGSYSGRHRSRQQGGAGEFADFREYSPGEDLRRLDWKVLARTGRPYLRLYEDETNLVCTLAIDASGSMLFNGQASSARNGEAPRGSKLEYIQYLATALAHVISRQQDRVGLAVLSDVLADYVPPGSTAGQMALLHGAIAKMQSPPATNLAEGLRELFGRSTQRGVLLLMSDFLVDDLDQVFASLRLFRHRHWEVVALHVIHPDEQRLPEGSAYRFEGLENDGRLDCTPAEIRQLYEQRFDAHASAIRSLALAAGCDYRRVLTSVPYLQTLGGFLVDRSG